MEEKNKPYDVTTLNNLNFKDQDYYYCIKANKFVSLEDSKISELKSKQDNSLLEEAKKRYPIGTKFKPAHFGGSEAIIEIINHEFTLVKKSIITLDKNSIKYLKQDPATNNCVPCLKENDKWAEIIEEPKSKFIGKWYVNPKWTTTSIAKLKEDNKHTFIYSEAFIRKEKSLSSSWNNGKGSERLATEQEINDYLPEGHPDRTDNKNIASFGDYKIGDKIKLLKNGGNESCHPKCLKTYSFDDIGKYATIQSFEKFRNYIVAICEEDYVLHLERYPEKFSKFVSEKIDSKGINWLYLDLEEWLREVKKLNLSEEEIAKYISQSDYCNYTKVYLKLEGSCSNEKAKILFEKWNKEKWIPQVDDWVVFMPEKAKDLLLYTECWSKPYVLKITSINGSSFKFSKEEMKRAGYESIFECGNNRSCFRKAEPHEIPNSNAFREQLKPENIRPYSDVNIEYIDLPLKSDPCYSAIQSVIYSKKESKKPISVLPEEKIIQFNKKSKKSNSIKCLTIK